MGILKLTPTSPVEQQTLVDAHFQAAAVYWKEIYERHDLLAVIHRERRAMVLELVDKLGLHPESHVLEIGCGAGVTTVALARRGYCVQAVDTVGPMLNLTRQLATETGVEDRVITSHGDVHDLAFPDNTFSLVLAIGLAPWLHSLNKAMQEIARVLKPGGSLIVTADNRWRLNHVLDPRLFPTLESARRQLRQAVEEFGLRKPTPRRPRAHRCSTREFDKLLSAVGLQKEGGTTFGFGPFSLFGHRILPDSIGVKLHHRLQSLSDRGFPVFQSTGAQYMVVARKPA